MRLADISYKYKLSVPFVVGSLFVLAIGLIGIRAVSSTFESSILLDQERELQALMLKLQNGHMNWANAVLETLADDQQNQINVETDPTRCELGRWLSSPEHEQALSRIPGIRNDLEQINHPHNELHQTVVTMQQMLNRGESRQAVLAYFHEQTLGRLEEVKTALNAVNNHIDEEVRLALASMIEVKAGTSQTVYIMVILGVIFSLLTVIYLYRLLMHPLQQCLSLAQSIDSGDLTQTISLQQNDEVGVLVEYLNRMAENLSRILAEIINTSQRLQNSSGEMMTASDSMSRSASEMNDASSSAASSSEEMTTGMDIISQNSEAMAASISSVAGATDQMTSTISEIARNSENAREITNRAVQNVSTAREQVRNLGEAARKIDKVLEVIVDIAEQTKLLALNATIEAARAGEAGKGFAVVANEVKELAKQTNEATADIRHTIEAIQKSATRTSDEIGSIDQVVNEVSNMVNSIAAAVEEQSVNTQDIAASTGQAAGNVGEVSSNISQMLEAARLITRDVAQVSSHSSQVYDTSTHVNSTAVELNSLSSRMQELVSGFKIDQNLLRQTSAKTESGSHQNLIEWSDNFSVQVTTIDRQHKRLVDLINKLHKAMRTGAARTVIAQVIGELVEYTQVHFKDEEKMMERAGYADLEKHKVQHFKFVEEIAQFQEKFNSGKTMISMDVMKFLKDWLLNHIQGTDKKYSADMIKAGIK